MTRTTTSVSGWEQVGEEFNRTYGRFRFGSTRTPPRFDQRAVADEHVMLARADLLSPIRATTATYHAPTVLAFLSGFLDLHNAQGTIASPRSGAFLIGGGGSSYLAEGDRPRVVVVQLSTAGLEDAARRLGDIDAVRADSLPALLPSASAQWWRAVADLKRVYESEELYGSYLVKRAAQRRLHEVAVEAFGLARPRDDRTPSARVVAAAKHYIDENLDTPLTVPAIAAAVHVSVRALQSSFARAGEVSPLRYLKRARLDAVRHDLRLGDAAQQHTVAEVARRWGFGSLGRFAAEYRDAFDELPRQTLGAERRTPQLTSATMMPQSLAECAPGPHRHPR